MPGTNTTGGDIDDRLRADIASQVARGSLSIQDACTRYQLSQESIVEWVAAFRHSSMMAFDEELRRTLADQGVDVSTLATAEFQGDLTDLTIADLVQTLTLGRRQGVITVSHAGRESRIWCADGEIVAAESGKLAGAAAVHRMLALEHGRVRASFSRVSRPRQMNVSTMELLLEGARRSDEAHALRSRLGSGLYRLAPKAMAVSDSLTEQEYFVLRQFDVPLRVPDVLAASALGDLETLTLLSRLILREYLLPEGEACSLPPSLHPLQASSPPLMLSIAHALADRRPRRWRAGVVLGLGALACAGWLGPRYLIASHDREPAAVSLPPAAAAPVEHVEPVELPRVEAIPIANPAPSPAETAPAAEAESSNPPPPARLRPSARKRAARASVSASDSPAASAKRSPAAHAEATESTSTEPRMRIIEEQLPKMQILE